jgi:hypothetical protein
MKNTHKNKMVEPENCKIFYRDIVEIQIRNIMFTFHVEVASKYRNTGLLGSRFPFEKGS